MHACLSIASGSMRKIISLLCILALVVSTSVLVQTVASQSITKPSVPEFTVKYVDYSYYVEPVYGVDEYSGQTVKTGGGFTYQNKSIEVSIKTQPFVVYTSDGQNIDLYYQIQYKGHFSEQWHTYSVARSLDSATVVLFGIDWGSSSGPTMVFGGLSAGEQVDFQVQAIAGYYTQADNQPMMRGPNYDVFHGESSGWSTTQTFTMPGTPSPTVPEFPTTAMLPLFVTIPLIVTLFLRKRNVFRTKH
jgi:hypothetical protein